MPRGALDSQCVARTCERAISRVATIWRRHKLVVFINTMPVSIHCLFAGHVQERRWQCCFRRCLHFVSDNRRPACRIRASTYWASAAVSLVYLPDPKCSCQRGCHSAARLLATQQLVLYSADMLLSASTADAVAAGSTIGCQHWRLSSLATLPTLPATLTLPRDCNSIAAHFVICSVSGIRPLWEAPETRTPQVTYSGTLQDRLYDTIALHLKHLTAQSS